MLGTSSRPSRSLHERYGREMINTRSTGSARRRRGERRGRHDRGARSRPVILRLRRATPPPPRSRGASDRAIGRRAHPRGVGPATGQDGCGELRGSYRHRAPDRRRSRRPGFLVGTALPDFAAMGRTRLGPADGSARRRHRPPSRHRSGVPPEAWFLDFERELRGLLRQDGLPDGAARACAHVGPGAAARRCAARRSRGQRAACAPSTSEIAAPDDDTVDLAPDGTQDRWRAHLVGVATRLDPVHLPRRHGRRATAPRHHLAPATARVRPPISSARSGADGLGAAADHVVGDGRARPLVGAVVAGTRPRPTLHRPEVGAMELTTALLCDHVQVREGLLFIVAGGITRLRRPSYPAALGAGSRSSSSSSRWKPRARISSRS